MTTYLLDYAWAQIPAQAAADAGYVAAIRYLGGSARLTPVERDNLHAAGLGILLVWETAADEAEHGERGAADAINANNEADALGYPAECPLFFADDHNDPDITAELAYFGGVATNTRRPWGVYSGGNVVRAVMDAHPDAYGWQVETWFPDAGANPHLIQLANSHEPYIAGVAPDQYDSNTLQRALPWWGGTGGDDVTTEKQMDTLGQWEQDTRAVILDKLVGDAWKDPNAHGILGTWMQQQSHVVITAVTANVDDALAKLPTGPGGTVSLDQVRQAVKDAVRGTVLTPAP